MTSSTPWMMPAWGWAMFAVLLALMLLSSLRFDWLKVWWQDQLRRASDADAAESAVADQLSTPEMSTARAQAPRQPRVIHAARAPAHRISGLSQHTITPHGAVQRTLFHRSGRRH